MYDGFPLFTNSLFVYFYRSFHFEDLRLDEALRLYLEAFRLPGEAPVISYLIEHFSEHWSVSCNTCENRMIMICTIPKLMFTLIILNP